MTHATKILREEHRWVRLLLDCLEELVGKFRSSGEFDSKAAKELQILFEHFVDQQHQEKEEGALFPKLMECLQKLQEDHMQEREHLERMRFSLFNAALGDPAGCKQFVDEAQGYLDLQRQHISHEDQGLLPLAEQLLTEQDDKEVLEEFRRREAGGIEHAKVRARVLELCSQLHVYAEAMPTG